MWKYEFQLFHYSTVRDENIIIQKSLILHILGLFSLLWILRPDNTIVNSSIYLLGTIISDEDWTAIFDQTKSEGKIPKKLIIDSFCYRNNLFTSKRITIFGMWPLWTPVEVIVNQNIWGVHVTRSLRFTYSCWNTHVGKATGCNAGIIHRQRCRTRERIYISRTPPPSTNKASHSGFQTQRRRYQKSKTEIHLYRNTCLPLGTAKMAAELISST